MENCRLILCKIGLQVLDRLEGLHSCGVIFRDVKPENFLFGINGKENYLYMIDLGLSKFYRSGSEHIPFKRPVGVTGTLRYMSLNATRGYEQSRRDDLESMVYLLLFLADGKLPWQNYSPASRDDLCSQVAKCKSETPISEICANVPESFQNLLKYCRELEFNEAPDYTIARNHLSSCLGTNDYEEVFEDWDSLPLSDLKRNFSIPTIPVELQYKVCNENLGNNRSVYPSGNDISTVSTSKSCFCSKRKKF